MKILVTGFPGTGKSAVATELKKRGYAVYDPETMRGYMHLESQQDGRPIHMPEHAPRGWFDLYGAFNWHPGRLQKLLDSAETVFICSLADNMEPFYDSFDKIFVLVLDDFELEQRLLYRGKRIDSSPEQRADILTLHRHFEASLINRGAIAINVHADVTAVVNNIIMECHSA